MKVSANEELLIAVCIKRDPDAIQTLVSLYGHPVYGFLHSALGRRAELAQDFIIDAFVKLLRSTTAFNLTEPLLVTVMRSVIKGIQKSLKRKDAEGPLTGLTPQLSVIFDSLSKIPWNERVLLLLRDQMDFSYEEIASITSIPKNQVRSRLKEARLQLRSYVQEALNQKRVPTVS